VTAGQPRRRGVTRGYVVGVVAAAVIVAAALVVAGWGMLGLVIARPPVSTTGVAAFAAEAIVLLALLVLAVGLWQQALVLLRGRQSPPWAHTIVLAAAAYLIWCLGGMLVGMSVDDTWLSPYSAVLAVAWGLCSLLFWAVLARRVYTDRPVPRWPWEKRDEGPDWLRYGEDREPRGDVGFGDVRSGDDREPRGDVGFGDDRFGEDRFGDDDPSDERGDDAR